MQRTLARDLPRHVGEAVRLVGWLHHVRDKGKIAFVLVRDRTGVAQGVVLDPAKVKVADLKRESIVEVVGRVKEEKQARAGVELEVMSVRPLIEPQAELPFEVSRSREKLNLKIDTILDHRAFSLRNPEFAAPFRVQAEIVRTFRDYLRRLDFLEVHTSKIVKAGTEGGTALFPVKYFEEQAYLAQSPQFYKQMLVGAGFERVFEVGFVYRAEDHATSRHINEYLSLDLEMGFIESYTDVIDVERGFLRELVENLRLHCQEEFNLLGAKLPRVGDMPEIRLKEALAILGRDYGRDTRGMVDLDPEGERQICDYALKVHGSEFVFVTRYPRSARPFYTMPDPEDEESTLGFDCLFRGLEVTTGSQRIHDYQMLVDSIRRIGGNPADFEFYLEIFRYAMPPHGGLAIGAERLTQQLLGLANVREASFFPRDRYRLTP
ncbi:MAG: aspartate--tRNA(Asn) ligase [candidate division WOR-3 bacterium]